MEIKVWPIRWNIVWNEMGTSSPPLIFLFTNTSLVFVLSPKHKFYSPIKKFEKPRWAWKRYKVGEQNSMIIFQKKNPSRKISSLKLVYNNCNIK